MLNVNPFVIKGFIVPVSFGGLAGLLVGIYVSKIKIFTEYLKEKNLTLSKSQKQHIESKERFKTLSEITYEGASQNGDHQYYDRRRLIHRSFGDFREDR